MGHDFITYGNRHVLLHDWDIWLLRHFFVSEAYALVPSDISTDQATLDLLRRYLEAWQWIGPGVVGGTELVDFVQAKAKRQEILLLLFHRVIARLEMMGEVIPLDYLEKHVNDSYMAFGKEQSTRKLIEAVKRLCEMLDEPPIL